MTILLLEYGCRLFLSAMFFVRVVSSTFSLFRLCVLHSFVNGVFDISILSTLCAPVVLPVLPLLVLDLVLDVHCLSAL